MPERELNRLKEVHRFLKLNISQEEELRNIIAIASEICQTPVALITFLDEDYQHIKFKVGFEFEKTPGEESFCQYVVKQDKVMVVPDTHLDDRFKNNPLVNGDPYIRFCAGIPLTTHDGYKIGSLCVLDNTPRQLSEKQLKMIEILSRQIIHILEFEMSVHLLKEQLMVVKSSEIKLRSLFESSLSCHLLIGINLEVLDFNHSLELFIQEIFGVKIGPGMLVTDFINEGNKENFKQNYLLAMSGKSIQEEKLLHYNNGVSIWWCFMYEPARDDEGKIIGISYNAININERKEQELKIINQNISLKEIARINSHELRGPVASILGLLTLIKEDKCNTDEYLNLLEKVVNVLDDTVHYINDQINKANL